MTIRHETSTTFWELYRKLDPQTRQLARKAYRIWKADSYHPSLDFKKIGAVWSLRICRNFRAVSHFHDNYYVWTWIGKHSEYDRMF